ncbi:MAG: ECF transporter S component [Firmicutes bacterium]|nr:ECF transporter S component [Bacillota bacterium]
MIARFKKIGLVLLCLLAAALSVVFWSEGYYLPLSLLLIVLSLIFLFVRFEKKHITPEAVVMIAALAGIAAVSRLPFASLPSVQPTSFVVIVSALVFGPEVGFMVGSAAALVSNLVLGQGPWTPWQMLAWGLMGLSAGYLKSSALMRSRAGRSAFGFIWGFLFGWFTNLSFILSFFGSFSWEFFLTTYAASFYFDLAHALSNAFFIILFSKQWQKILSRISVKYKIFY